MRLISLLLFIVIFVTLVPGCTSKEQPMQTEVSPSTTTPVTTTYPVETTVSSEPTPEELYLDETDATLLALLEEAGTILSSGERIILKKNSYLTTFYNHTHSIASYIEDKEGLYVVHNDCTDDVRPELQYLIFLDLLLERYSDYIYNNYRPNASWNNYSLTFCENYKALGYETIAEYAADNWGTHHIRYDSSKISTEVYYEYYDMRDYIDLTDIPNSFPQHYDIAENKHYTVIRRRYDVLIDFHNDFEANTDPSAFLTFPSFDALKNAILTGNFTDEQLQTITTFEKNNRNDIFILDLERKYTPLLPEGLQVESVDWSGGHIQFNLSGNGISGYMHYDRLHNPYSESLQEYHNFSVDEGSDYFFNKYFSYANGSFYVLEVYQRSVSETVPVYIKYWNTNCTCYGYLNGFQTKPTTEWIYSLGMEFN